MNLSEKEIELFNLNQKSDKVHPYTCDRNSQKCEVKIIPRDYTKDGVLIATKNGLICPCGDYKQFWSE